MGYVDGSTPCPAAHVAVNHGGVIVSQPNPAYQHWVQQDQAILSAFVSSMTEGVVGMVLFAATAQEAWETLSGAFASTSIARSSGIRQQMADLKKRDMTITVYFHRMKSLADSLTSIGMPLRDEEFISYVLAGLDSEYDALYEVVSARTTAMPIRDLFAQLLSTEHRIASRRGESGLHYPAAHTASYGGPHVAAYGAARGGGFRPAYRPDQRGSQPTHVQQQKASAPSTGNPGGRRNNRVTCQLCGIVGHTSSRCFKRFNRDFLGIGNDGSGTERQIAMAMAAAQGGVHSGQQQSVDPAWYADSGATHHVTHELEKLTTREPYHGTDQVHAANGIGSGHEGTNS